MSTIIKFIKIILKNERPPSHKVKQNENNKTHRLESKNKTKQKNSLH